MLLEVPLELLDDLSKEFIGEWGESGDDDVSEGLSEPGLEDAFLKMGAAETSIFRIFERHRSWSKRTILSKVHGR